MAATSSDEGSSARNSHSEAHDTSVHRVLSSGDGGLSASGYRAIDGSHARILRPSDDWLGLRCPTSPGMERDSIATGARRIGGASAVERKSVFSCHAFSRDGTRLAAGETGGKIQMWDTHKYSCIAETHTAARTKICALCFLDGSNDSIIVVDDCGEVTKFSFLWNWRKSSNGRESKCEADSVVKASLHYHNPITHHHSHMYEFSECGRRVAYYEQTENRDQGHRALSRIDLYEITDDSVRVCKVMINESESGYRLPLLSDTGCSLLICSQTGGIQVFPKLTFTVDHETAFNESNAMSQEPLLQQDSQASVVVEGDRASWGKNGLFLVWSSKDGFPLLSVYNTKDMKTTQEVQTPWRTLDLGVGSSSWEARFVNCTESDNDSMAILISEDFAHNRKRFLLWDAEKDTANSEICVKKPERRFRAADRDYFFGNERASSIVEGSLPVMSIDAYQIRIREDNWQRIDVSRKTGLVGFYSWQSHACVFASLKSGVAFKEISLPDDEHFHPFETPVQAGFDPLGSHFVVFGDSAIFAFTERYMCPDGQTASEECAPAASNMSHNGSSATLSNLTQGPQTKYDHFVSLLSFLPGRALCPSLLSQTESMDSDWRFGAYLDIMNQRHIVDAAMAPDGRCLTFLLRDDAQNYKLLTFDARKCHKRDVNGVEEPLSAGKDDAFTPERVFLHQNETDSELELVLVSRFPRAKALFRTVMSSASVPFECNIEEYLMIKQTCDHRRLVLLTRDSVCLLDLHDRVCSRIQYKVKFDLLLQKVQPHDQDYGNDYSQGHRVSRISDNGKCVLLAWNARTRRSILVNPSSTQDACEKRIEAAGHLTSLFCSLSWNGACTIFIDCDERRNGRITVGFFNHEAEEVIQRKHVVEQSSLKTYKEADFFSLLQDLCFAISKDGKSLVIATTQSFHETAWWYTNERFRKIPLQWSAFYRNKQTEEKEVQIDEMLNIAKHSRKSLARFCNEPTGFGLSLYQTIVVKGYREKAEEIQKLANGRGIDLAVEWTTESGGHDDILNHAFKKESTSCVRRAVRMLASRQVPFRSAASIFTRSFSKLLFQHADVVYGLLRNNSLIHTVAAFDVSEVFADPRLRRNKAVHIRTTNTCLEWQLADCASLLEKNWENQTADIVEALGISENDTKVKMSLQFIQIENVAKTGSEGIVRSLLLQKEPSKFFKCDLARWIIDYKWFTVWRQRFLAELTFYLLFLVIFTLYAVAIAESGSFDGNNAYSFGVASTLLVLLWICGCFGLLKETTYILTLTIDGKKLSGSHLHGWSCYRSNMWNAINLISSLLIVFVIPSLHLFSLYTGVHTQELAIIVAIEVVLAYAKVWYYTQPFSSTEGLVFMVGSIFYDSWVFLGLLVTVWIGFGVAMFVVSSYVVDHERESYMNESYMNESYMNVSYMNENYMNEIQAEYGSVRQSLVTLLTGAILGDYNTDVYRLKGLAGRGAVFTLILYVVIQSLLLLNSLYSMMGDSCQKARALQRIFLTEGRARIIDACEGSCRAHTLQKINEGIGTYLCVLTPTEETQATGDDSEPWTCMTDELEKVLSKKIADSERILKASFEKCQEEMRNNMESMMRQVCHEMREMKEACSHRH